MWTNDLNAAIAEARRTRRPILSLRLLGRLDEELSCANSRFFKKLLYPHARVQALLRRFVLHWQSVRPVPRVTIDFGNGKKIERTLTGNSLHLVLDLDGRPMDALPGLFDPDTFCDLLEAGGQMRRTPHRAVAASMVAPTKHMVEAPLLRALIADTPGNLELYDRVQRALRARAWTADELVDWIYRELFLMDLSDPWLGLDVSDPDFQSPQNPTVAQGTSGHRSSGQIGWRSTPTASKHATSTIMPTRTRA
jgi:hypothetical protein